MSAEQERMPQRQLGQLMTELGLISAEQLATVLEVQQRSKRPIGQIIVELGFASGAAVAHALAMQSGGALRTEYGFALGVPPVDGNADSEETAGLGLSARIFALNYGWRLGMSHEEAEALFTEAERLASTIIPLRLVVR